MLRAPFGRPYPTIMSYILKMVYLVNERLAGWCSAAYIGRTSFRFGWNVFGTHLTPVVAIRRDKEDCHVYTWQNDSRFALGFCPMRVLDVRRRSRPLVIWGRATSTTHCCTISPSERRLGCRLAFPRCQSIV